MRSTLKLNISKKTMIMPGILMLSVLASQIVAQPTGNVVFYSGNPEEDADAYPYVGANVPGYLTGVIVPFNGSDVTFSTASVDPMSGFVPDSNEVLNQEAPVGSYVLFNQINPEKSVAFYGDMGVYDETGAHAVPNPGTYSTPQTVSFITPDALTHITYSIDGGGDLAWDGTPIQVVKDTSITYQGTRNAMMGPQKTVVYTIETLNCSDIDGDDIPDRIEVEVGLDPFLAEGDANKNMFNDFDALVRGATSIVPPMLPDLDDTDNDDWFDYDEDLRGTNSADPDDKPASPSFDTVEIIVSGNISATSSGIFPPGAPVPEKPVPDLYQVEVLTPGGIPFGPADSTDVAYSLHTSGEQFHYIRAKAQDGSGRMLLSVVPPKGLCIDEDVFCGDGDDLAAWRAGYLAQYEANILHNLDNNAIDPRSTAEALLLNRYYELAEGNVFVPGVENEGPDLELVFQLRSQRNEAELFASIQASVTTEMITVVTDYFQFATSPGEFSMMEQLEMIFAGVSPEMDNIPAGVRTANFAPVGTQVSDFFLNLEEGETILTGNIQIEPSGFELDVNGTIYRLTGLADTFTEGSSITIRALIDIDDCNFTSPFARVTELISRTPAPLMAGEDSDMDDLDDDWELFNFGDLDEDGMGDPDMDGINNEDEEENNLNPLIPDSPVFVSYQGDSDLSLIVNAADLVITQNTLGADYSCETCRGRGDANGNGTVAVSDLDAVGENLFAVYPPADCTLIEIPCNKSALPVLEIDNDGAKGVSSPIMSVTGVPNGIVVNDTFSVTVSIDTDGSAIRAASSRILFDDQVLEVMSVTPNTTTFDAYTIATIGDGNIDIAVLSTADEMGDLEIATIEFKAIANGISPIEVDTNPDISTIVQGNGTIVGNLQTIDDGVTIGIMAEDQWIIF